ncbi:MAG: glycosyltransferase [Bacteroidales bacterium]|nr:glycosyltransferase [Bacteroidales bacterium]
MDENQTNEVEILAGAFMLLRKTVLDEIGLLDESFFMYGEDIDLSYRVIQAGYRNYYFPETRIIHYKGESTKKSSVNYVLVFYNAMVIFAKKHFTHKNARAFTFVINIAIYFRAFLAILSQLWEKLMLPLVDGAAMVGGFYLITKLWGDSFIYKEGGSYPLTFVYYIIPSYIVLWLLSIYFSGGYDKPVRIKKAVGGLLLGTVLILVLYALLPESMRFSRALILLGTLWGLLVLPVVRLLFHWMKVPWVALGDKQSKRFLVIGEKDEAKRVMELLESSFVKPGFIGLASVDKQTVNAGDYIGNISQAKDIITIYNIDEVVFCSKNISHQTIIDKMAEWQQMEVDYKIAPEDSLSIIGSNSIHTRGDLYTVNINAVDKTANRRNKRLIDVFVSLILLLFSPVLVFFERKPSGFLKNVFCVLLGRKSWVGFCETGQADFRLPNIKPGVLCPLDGMKVRQQNKETIHQLNLLYARDYNLLKDVNIILFAFRDLGK